MPPYIIAVDLGGTQIRTALCSPDGQIFRRIAKLTLAQEGQEAVIERIGLVLHDHRASMLNAVGLRMTRSDTFSLSPCFGRDTYWIDLFFDGRDSQFDINLTEAVEDCGSRCHWGKYLALAPAHLRGQYPRLDQFKKVKAELDPDGLFANAYTRGLGI